MCQQVVARCCQMLQLVLRPPALLRRNLLEDHLLEESELQVEGLELQVGRIRNRSPTD